MLRIERADRGEGFSTLTLRLEGRLMGPWVIELWRTCDGLDLPPDSLCLDLAAVTFIDLAGLALLRRLARRGMVISGCSPFIERLLSEEGLLMIGPAVVPDAAVIRPPPDRPGSTADIGLAQLGRGRSGPSD